VRRPARRLRYPGGAATPDRGRGSACWGRGSAERADPPGWPLPGSCADSAEAGAAHPRRELWV